MAKNIEKTIYHSQLFDLYKNMLSLKTRDRLDYYLNQDYSLAEIAANENTSRNAVFESINNGIAKLIDLEEKLHLKEKTDKILTKLEDDDYSDLDKIIEIIYQ